MQMNEENTDNFDDDIMFVDAGFFSETLRLREELNKLIHAASVELFYADNPGLAQLHQYKPLERLRTVLEAIRK